MRVALSIAAFVLVLIYPLAVYYGLTQLETRQTVWLLLPLLAVLTLAHLPKQRGAHLVHAPKIPLAMALLLSLTAFLDDHRFLLITPVLINAVLLFGFAGSLRTATPLVERFARLQVPDLTPAEVAYCRQVTIAWCIFFVVNGTLAGLLAWLTPLSIWALYTGGIAYVLLGAMASTEYIIRKLRFGRFNRSPLDRLLQLVLPKPRSSSP